MLNLRQLILSAGLLWSVTAVAQDASSDAVLIDRAFGGTAKAQITAIPSINPDLLNKINSWIAEIHQIAGVGQTAPLTLQAALRLDMLVGQVAGAVSAIGLPGGQLGKTLQAARLLVPTIEREAGHTVADNRLAASAAVAGISPDDARAVLRAAAQ